MVPPLTDVRPRDARNAPGSAVSLAATLYCDGISAPVKILDISTSGALIEGPVMPAVDALVQLVRGILIVHGLVVWSAQGRCGLKFSGCVTVEEWSAVGSHGEQQRVDEVVRLVRAGAVPMPVTALERSGQHCEPANDGQLSSDLRRVCELLEKLGDVLANDIDVVMKHGTSIQNLDIAIQVIAAVEAMVSGHYDSQIGASKLLGLRRSADEAVQQGHSGS